METQKFSEGGVDYIEIDQQKFIDQMLKILEEKFWNIAEPQ